MGYYQVSPGQLVEDKHMNLAINQGVLVFDDATQRTAQLATPTEGMQSYLKSIKIAETYKDGKWQATTVASNLTSKYYSGATQTTPVNIFNQLLLSFDSHHTADLYKPLSHNLTGLLLEQEGMYWALLVCGFNDTTPSMSLSTRITTSLNDAGPISDRSTVTLSGQTGFAQFQNLVMCDVFPGTTERIGGKIVVNANVQLAFAHLSIWGLL